MADVTHSIRLTQTLNALARLANDPDETPERRAKAKKAIDLSITELPNLGSPIVSRSYNRGHSGGDSLHQDAIYDGWDSK